jgi:ankyrin repeat protein
VVFRKAIEYGDIKVFKFLVKHFGLIYSPPCILDLACSYGRIDIVEYLIDRKENLAESFICKLQDIDCRIALFSVSSHKIIKQLIRAANISRDDFRQNYMTVFLYACTENNIETVLFLTKYFNLTTEDVRCFNNSAIQYTCQYGYINLVRFLVITFNLTKADILYNNKYALIQACRLNRLEIIKFLIPQFKITIIDCNLMFIAQNAGHRKIVEYLQEIGW